ncbi:MAG: hypothetical protein FJX74_14945 [Armatimonadetes bacterium]|nr:hypothetical protein [Armatimonadota bacterium]
MADDFRCNGANEIAFSCLRFGGCHPSGSTGVFRCSGMANEFDCLPHEIGAFNCETGRFAQ